MIKIVNVKRISNELVEYELENGDNIILSDTEIRRMEESHEGEKVASMGELTYYTELSEVEYSDDTSEIIGFSLV